VANLSVTAANVRHVSGEREVKVSGEAITAGVPLYTAIADGKVYKADNNDTAAKAAVTHIALSDAAGADQFVVCAKPDSVINLGATLTVGGIYIVSATVGLIADAADVSTNFVTVLGIATTAALFKFNPIISGIQHA
jgi:hypothetical protein